MKKLLLMLLLTASCWAQTDPNAQMMGAWISPDWFLPGGRTYNAAEVRQRARQVLGRLSESGINMVFLETFLRGYSIASANEIKGHVAHRQTWLPMYPHLNWGLKTEVDNVQDTLQIFIEEGRAKGIEIHAWTHMFYWKMDNPGAMLSWHSPPSLWSQMMVEYLDTQASALQGRKEVAPDTVALLREAARVFEKTTEARDLARLLQQHGLDDEGRPMGILVRQAMRAGAPAPDFLLIHSAEDPFPAPRGKQLRPVYLNPACPRVRETLTRVVTNLANGHPGLAGIHLDHIRYPVDGQGLSPELMVQDGTYNYYGGGDAGLTDRYQRTSAELAQRRDNLRTLVDGIRAGIPKEVRLSAAVLPVYYRERDNGRLRLGGYDFSSQDWVGWKVDFVVPMLYEMSTFTIRNLLSMVAEEQDKRLGKQAITVYPGVSQMRIGRSGELQSPGFVFFDLNLARDVKLEKKEETEDLNFGAQ